MIVDLGEIEIKREDTKKETMTTDGQQSQSRAQQDPESLREKPLLQGVAVADLLFDHRK